MHLLSPSLPSNLVHLIRRLLHALSTLSTSSTAAFSALEPNNQPKSPDLAETNGLNGGASADNGSPAATPTPTPTSQQQQPPSQQPQKKQRRNTPLEDLLANPALYSPLRKPRLPIVLCHGLYGFDVRGPSSFPALQLHYWSSVLDVLRDKIGAEVIVTGVSGTGSIESRAAQMDQYLQKKVEGRELNFIGHSMGGLDCRHLISNIKPSIRDRGSYHPKSLTTISTPHRGSPFMDWCMANIGIGTPRAAGSPPTDPRRPPGPPLNERILDEKNANGFEFAVDEKKTMSEASLADSREQLLNPSAPPLNSSTEPPHAPSSRPHPSSESIPDSDDLDSSGIPKLPFSLPKPIFSPPPEVPYPLPLLSMGTYSPSTFSLPALLLSLIDSPAYSNLTTIYLKGFNKRTPDDPNIRYFSVASRKDRSKFGLWHPLWFPKLVVDSVPSCPPPPYSTGPDSPYSPSDLEGNDGLVPVTSAMWGELLGVVENCDHWEIRGAGGMRNLNLSLSLNIPNISSLPLGLGLGWEGMSLEKVMSLGDWKKQKQTDALEREEGGETRMNSKDTERERERERHEQALTDRLSAVVDWIVDWSPSSKLKSGSGSNGTGAADMTRTMSTAATAATVSGSGVGKKEQEETRKWNLERFYVALCRKLYDEGL